MPLITSLDGYEKETAMRPLRESFATFDKDGSGKLSAKELKKVLQRGHGLALSDDDVKELLQHFDTNQDGEIDIDEFCVAMTSHLLLANGPNTRSGLANQGIVTKRHGKYTRLSVDESLKRTKTDLRVVFAPVPEQGKLQWTIKVKEYNHVTCRVGICTSYSVDPSQSRSEESILVYAQGLSYQYGEWVSNLFPNRHELIDSSVKTNGKYGAGDKLTCTLDLCENRFSILKNDEPYVEFTRLGGKYALSEFEWCPLLTLSKDPSRTQLSGNVEAATNTTFDVAFSDVSFPNKEAQRDAINRFEHARHVHVLSTRFHGISYQVAAQAKKLLEAQEGVACFNPNSDNAVIAGQDKGLADAVWLKKWRQMLKRAATKEQRGVVIQLLCESEGLSDMQDSEAEMAEDKNVDVVQVRFSHPMQDSQMRSLLQAQGLLQ